MYSFLFKRGFILPVTVTAIVPVAIVFVTGAWTRATVPMGVGGAVLIVFGFGMLMTTTRLFARGNGSLAPWNPPSELVVAGPYRYSRNPMITGIYAILIGETLAFRTPWIAGWALVFISGMSGHIFFQEEPLLRRRFGEAYERYCDNVPRWLPRLKPYVYQRQRRAGFHEEEGHRP